MDVSEGRPDASFFTLYYGDIVIDNNILPHILLVDFEDVNTVGIHSLILKYLLKQSWAPHHAIQRSQEIVLNVAFPVLCDFNLVLKCLCQSELLFVKDVPNSHPFDLVPNFEPTLLAGEE
jgi:hypothetical protein